MAMWVLFLLVPSAAQAGSDGTISKVVNLLEEMLDKSKSDGTEDRTVYAKFKCYCDTTTKSKTEGIATTTNDIDMSNSELADLRAANTKMTQEIAKLEADMSGNEEARTEALNIRTKEKEDFETEEANYETGIDQLDRAIQLLVAIGADQTVTGDTDSAQLLKEAGFMSTKSSMKKGQITHLTEDMKAALRAASVHLDGGMRSKMAALIQAPTGNYNSQSGEIAGLLKNMLDTFKANLATARSTETKKIAEYESMKSTAEAEYGGMETSLGAKEKEVGDNAAAIATTSGEVETMEGQVSDDQEFLATLTERCNTKKADYEKRNMLRANEEAAIAEAISILNSDAAFAAFGKVDETATGRSTFLQVSAVNVRSKIMQRLSGHLSARVQKVMAALKSDNPFTKVVALIENSITIIDDEEKADVEKKDWCEDEQTTNEANKGDKETSIQSLEDAINQLEISISQSKSSIEDAETDLKENRDSQAATTKTREEAHAQFSENKKNMEEAERILAKATEVLTKYYTFLHSHNAEKSYAKKAGKDSGGGNLKRLAGKSVTELEEGCSALPECVAFNSAGWLKSALAPEEEWYDWADGDLYVKELSFLQVGHKQPLEGEPEGDFNTGQGESGNKAIDMLTFIAGETKKSREEAITDEATAKSEYDTEMGALTTAETNLVKDLEGYNLALTTAEKQLNEATEDKDQTTKEHTAIVKYLAEIEPGCTFIQTNYETRKQNRAGEKTALQDGIALIKATPIFQAAIAAQDKEDLGKCAPVCEEEGADHAKCLSCQEGVTVFGWCASPDNSSAPGCDEATTTGSAAALGA
jgi:hypothetical protein